MDRCQGGEMVGSSRMEEKPDIPSWEAILLTVEGQNQGVRLESWPGDQGDLGD